jgi:hypothetical protein
MTLRDGGDKRYTNFIIALFSLFFPLPFSVVFSFVDQFTIDLC